MELYTFRGATPEQVDELCELWQEAVVDFNRKRGLVRVESDQLSIDQFITFYSLQQYLDQDLPKNEKTTPRAAPGRPRLYIV